MSGSSSGMLPTAGFPPRFTQSLPHLHTARLSCSALRALSLQAIWDAQVPSVGSGPATDQDRENSAGRTGEERSGDGESMNVGSPNPFYS